MLRNTELFPIENIEYFKQQMLGWLQQFSICCFLDNNFYTSPYHSFEWLCAAGAVQTFNPEKNKSRALKEFFVKNNDWLFGHISYDFNDETGHAYCTNEAQVLFPGIFFFQPQIVICPVSNKQVRISSYNNPPLKIFKEINSFKPVEIIKQQPTILQSKVSEKEYAETVEKLRKHILKGDCYEINYCIEFFAENAIIHPLSVYRKLVQLSPNPFAAFYKLDNNFLLCASPERYLKKLGNKVISQPIKGTIAKSKSAAEDKKNKHYLLNSAKERSENVMVVDLVRNDLSKICKEGSVQVEELFGIYTFPQLHQMISTVIGTLEENISFADILEATFPMGSMTGAPKKRVMELIGQYEKNSRGIFSGTIGYIQPNGDFDFNVVIRSIMYNAATKYLSYKAGSGITFYSNARDEYNECLLKCSAIEKVL